jgi:hypothetical protein
MTDDELREELRKVDRPEGLTILDEVAAEVAKLSPDEIREEARKIARTQIFRAISHTLEPQRLANRPFTLDIGDPNDASWSSVRPGEAIKALQGVSFGFAEEVLGLVEYTDGTFLVGIGESLRPFLELYRGSDAELASDIFFRKTFELAYTEGV